MWGSTVTETWACAGACAVRADNVFEIEAVVRLLIIFPRAVCQQKSGKMRTFFFGRT